MSFVCKLNFYCEMQITARIWVLIWVWRLFENYWFLCTFQRRNFKIVLVEMFDKFKLLGIFEQERAKTNESGRETENVGNFREFGTMTCQANRISSQFIRVVYYWRMRIVRLHFSTKYVFLSNNFREMFAFACNICQPTPIEFQDERTPGERLNVWFVTLKIFGSYPSHTSLTAYRGERGVSTACTMYIHSVVNRRLICKAVNSMFSHRPTIV